MAAGKVDTVGDQAAVTVARGEVLAARTGDSAVVVDSAARLPFEYLGLDRDSATPMTYRPIYIAERRLQYRPTDDRFAGSVLLGLQDAARPATEAALATPVRLRLSGDADSVLPDNVALQRTNSQYERVLVVARNAQDSVRLRIVPTFDPAGVYVWLPVEPALAFEQTPAPIQGLGVETATLVIGTRGLRLRDSLVVTVSANKGGLATNEVVVGRGPGLVKLRSSGLGPVSLRASAPGFQPAETTVQFAWPIRFLLAALAGGAIGGIGGARLASKRPSRQLTVRYSVQGLVLGFIAAVLYFGLRFNALLVDVDIQFVNEIAVFAFALLGGLLGLPAISALLSNRKNTG